jgi:hypothetical protein
MIRGLPHGNAMAPGSDGTARRMVASRAPDAPGACSRAAGRPDTRAWLRVFRSALALAVLVATGPPAVGQVLHSDRKADTGHARPAGAPARAPGVRPQAPSARPHVPDLRLDQRYHHDHYYPPRGHVTPMLPGGSIGLVFGQGNFFFHGGVWFRPSAGRFVVVAPPIGIVVPFLPPAYATVWVGGLPYFYANGVYYAQGPGSGYVVVAPPPGAEAAQPVLTLPAEPVIYPRNGQTAEQTESDRRECNRWADTQAGAKADVSVHQRAVSACMDARGYTLR